MSNRATRRAAKRQTPLELGVTVGTIGLEIGDYVNNRLEIILDGAEHKEPVEVVNGLVDDVINPLFVLVSALSSVMTASRSDAAQLIQESITRTFEVTPESPRSKEAEAHISAIVRHLTAMTAALQP
jgi:hypothetical protein